MFWEWGGLAWRWHYTRTIFKVAMKRKLSFRHWNELLKWRRGKVFHISRHFRRMWYANEINYDVKRFSYALLENQVFLCRLSMDYPWIIHQNHYIKTAMQNLFLIFWFLTKFYCGDMLRPGNTGDIFLQLARNIVALQVAAICCSYYFTFTLKIVLKNRPMAMYK